MKTISKFSLLAFAFFICSSSFASVTFYNRSVDTMQYSYKICNMAYPETCSEMMSTDPMSPGVHKDDSINMVDGQQMFVYSVLVTPPHQSSYTKTFSQNSGGFTNCYAYQDDGLLFLTFPKQKDVFCTPGTAKKTK